MDQRVQEIKELQRQIAIAELAKAALEAKDDLTAFCRFTMPSPADIGDVNKSLMQDAAHQRLIDEKLMAVERGDILYLVITMPPRHGKSERVSRRFPAWFIGRNPWSQVIFTTYGQEFADEFGLKWKEIIGSPRYHLVFPEVSIKTESRAQHHLGIQGYDGEMYAVGMGGTITGRGADLLIIDDPIKGPDVADSLTMREKQWTWYQSVAYTRLMPGARIVIVLTRWSEDDLVGRLFNEAYIPKEEQKKWHVLHLPAIEGEGTPNEKALWPERYNLEYLRSVRRVSSSRVWNALWQNKPTPPEGAFFRADQIYEYTQSEMPKEYRGYLTGDLALTVDLKANHTCVGYWMQDPDDVLYLHPNLFWDKRRSDACIEEIVKMMALFRENLMMAWWEKGQIEKAIGPFLFKAMSEHAPPLHVPIIALPVSGDKGRRASAINGRMSMAKVRFPAWAPWWKRAKDQILKFTGTGDDPEDDFVDMMSLIGQALGFQIAPRKSEEKGDSNVIPLTYGWMIGETRRQEAERQQSSQYGGM